MRRGWPKEIRFQHVSELSKADIRASHASCGRSFQILGPATEKSLSPKLFCGRCAFYISLAWTSLGPRWYILAGSHENVTCSRSPRFSSANTCSYCRFGSSRHSHMNRTQYYVGHHHLLTYRCLGQWSSSPPPWSSFSYDTNTTRAGTSELPVSWDFCVYFLLHVYQTHTDMRPLRVSHVRGGGGRERRDMKKNLCLCQSCAPVSRPADKQGHKYRNLEKPLGAYHHKRLATI